MNNLITVGVALVFSFVVYLGFCKKGFRLGYLLNFLCGFANLFLQNENLEITMITVATILLVTAVVTFIEYIAFQKTQSFFGYLAYGIFLVVVIGVGIYLTKLLFTFLGNPSMLYKK